MLTIYKASAGSGKTYTLTKNYLTLLLGDKHTADDGTTSYSLNTTQRNRHRSILAITFTNKATAEMKERIIQHLSRLSGQGEKSDYVDALIKTFGCTNAELQQQAKRALNDILFDYQNFNVSTIDAFFQQVLRSLALELDHPGDFTVEISQDTVLNEGLHRMMSSFNATTSSDTPLERTILKYMQAKRQTGKQFNIFNRGSHLFTDMASMSGDLFDEKYKILANDIDPWLDDPVKRAAFANEIEAIVRDTKQEIVDTAKAIVDNYFPAFEAGLNANSIVPQTKSMAAGKLLAPKSINNTGPQIWSDPNSPIEKYFTKAYLKKNSVDPAAFNSMRALYGKIVPLHMRLYTFEPIARELPVYDFMAEVRKFINEYRLENGVVVLSDTNTILRDVMRHDADVPFIYEKMAMRLRHFLIDEFQDTSRMQWENLKPLILNSLATNNDNLIIGDEKQSIYRFRNSDSSMLHHGIAQDPKFSGKVEIEGTREGQNTNWRSAPVIVNFNNSLFTTLSTNLRAAGYENVVQLTAEKHADLPGRVQMHALTTSKKAESTDSPKDDNLPKNTMTPTEQYRENTLNLLIERILQQRANGYSWRDIAVIANKNSGCAEVVGALQKADIPVATDDALNIDASPIVRLIVSGMRLVYESIIKPETAHKNDRRSLVFSNKFEFHYTRAIAEGTEPADALAQTLDICVKEAADTDALPDFVANVISLQPSTLVALSDTVLRERLLRGPEDTDPQKLTTFDLPADEKAYVAAFNDVIHDYVSINGNDLGGFLRFWDKHHDKLNIAGDRNADMVTVLTIHKSKGLQYPCLHIPFVDYCVKPDAQYPDHLWVTPDLIPNLPWGKNYPPALRLTICPAMTVPQNPLYPCYVADEAECIADNLNKTYVAFTRAERELDVYYNPAKDIGKDIRQAIDELYPANNDGNLLIGNDTTPKAKKKEDKTGPEALITHDADTAPFYAVAHNKDADGVTHITTIAPGEIDISNMPIIDDENDPAADVAIPVDPTKRGDILHYVMSRIQSTRDVAKMVRKYRHLISDDDAALINNMFEDPQYAPWIDRWFTPGLTALNEISLMAEQHEDAHVRRIDRLIFRPDGTAEILDYKFTSTIDDDGYRPQLEEYARLVRAAYPGITVHAWLWYVDLAEIHQLI